MIFPTIGNCSDYQMITLHQTLSSGRPVEHYQLRIELSPGDPSHCITIGCADGSVGDTILQQWRDGSFWCNTSDTVLCPSNDTNTTFYSKLFNISGETAACDFTTGTESSNSSDHWKCSGNTTSFVCLNNLLTPTSTSQGIFLVRVHVLLFFSSDLPASFVPFPTPLFNNCSGDNNWEETSRCTAAISVKIKTSDLRCSARRSKSPTFLAPHSTTK